VVKRQLTHRQSKGEPLVQIVGISYSYPAADHPSLIFRAQISGKPVIQQLGSLIPWRKHLVKKMGQILRNVLHSVLRIGGF
jgi:hypothetical protein